MSDCLYERIRTKNVARNRAIFASTAGLQLALPGTDGDAPSANAGDSLSAAPTRKRKRTRSAAATPTAPTRVSQRIRAFGAGKPSLSQTSTGGGVDDSLTGTAEWALRLMDEGDETSIELHPTASSATHASRTRAQSRANLASGSAGTSARSARSGAPSLRWDSRRMHQHLELSASGRTVVTTGCAGYGGVMALAQSRQRKSTAKGASVAGGTSVATVRARGAGPAPTTSGRVPGRGRGGGKGGGSGEDEVAWHVECVAEGVGGFAVGVADAAAKGPYKSWGRRPDSWVWHSEGVVLHNSSRLAMTGGDSKYGEGDRVSVCIGCSGRLSFALNGSRQRLDAGVTLSPGNYILCAQPYMGGAARMLRTIGDD